MNHGKEEQAVLVLEDGKCYIGESYGALGSACGEIVFTTGMTGYQESLTDPSYAGQILVQTAPHIGNTGVNTADNESGKVWVAGYVIREAARVPSNWRAEEPLEDFLMQDGIVGIKGVDTRAITRHIREYGAMRAGIFSGSDAASSSEELIEVVRRSPQMQGASFSDEVTTRAGYTVNPSDHGWTEDIRATLAIVDLGVKATITRNFAENGVKVHVLPASSNFDVILQTDPDGVFYSNGPGDPSTATYQVGVLKQVLAAKIPFFGICFGNQLLGQALGFDTYKLRYGHHGINQPVQDKTTGKIEITVHNHGFAVNAPIDKAVESKNGFGRVIVSHVCLNDDVVEGLKCLDIPAFSVQYHPEAAAGPHDAEHLFQQFIALMEQHKDGEPYFLSSKGSLETAGGEETESAHHDGTAVGTEPGPQRCDMSMHYDDDTEIEKPGPVDAHVPVDEFPEAFSAADLQSAAVVAGDGGGDYHRSPFIVPLFSKKKFQLPQEAVQKEALSAQISSGGSQRSGVTPADEPNHYTRVEEQKLLHDGGFVPHSQGTDEFSKGAYLVAENRSEDFIESLKGRISEPVKNAAVGNDSGNVSEEEPPPFAEAGYKAVEEVTALPQPYNVSEVSVFNSSDINTAAQIQDMLDRIQQSREGVVNEAGGGDPGELPPLSVDGISMGHHIVESGQRSSIEMLQEPPLPQRSPSSAMVPPPRPPKPVADAIPVSGAPYYEGNAGSADTKEKLQEEVGNFFDNIVTTPPPVKKPRIRLFKGFRGGKDKKGER